MATFSYTKLKKYSMGNRVAYTYRLTNVNEDSTSILRTPFKKITGYLFEKTSTAGSTIIVVANNERTSANNEATLTLDTDTESSGEILVVGLL